MVLVIISLLITIATFYLMAYYQKIDYNKDKVTVGDMCRNYEGFLAIIFIPVVNVALFIMFAGILLFRIFKDVKIL